MPTEDLTGEEKRRLLEQLLRERLEARTRAGRPLPAPWQPPEAYRALEAQFQALDPDGVDAIYFLPSEGLNTSLTRIHGREFINFCSYNYLGLSGEAGVTRAAQEAIARYGTSVSASRLASGERPLHAELEQALAAWLGVEDCLTFIGGFGTNETTLGHLCGPEDLILYDSLSHASIQTGARLSGATLRPFPHNGWEALDVLLTEHRRHHRHAVVVVEGVYSMDGDVPDLPRFIEVKRRHQALLMVDEAHSIGVLGRTGAGLGEHYGVARQDVDLWMGTLSKALASCGGYVAGSRQLVAYLRHTAPGYVYSVGMTPANAAAALAALRLLQREPWRVARLQENADRFRQLARQAGLPIGPSAHGAVVPVLLGRSAPCVHLFRTLYAQGVYALPILHPTVPDNAARLRFFLSSQHTEAQMAKAVAVMAEALQPC